MKVISLEPKGACGGVTGAILLAMHTLSNNYEGKPFYLIGSLVHNEVIMKDLFDAGAILLSERDGSLLKQMETIPDGSIVLYSAHGHDEEAYDEIAKRKNFIVYDATCHHIKENLKKMKGIKDSIAFICDPKHLEAISVQRLSNVTVIDPKNPMIDRYDYVISQTSLDEETVVGIENKLKAVNPNIISLGGRCPSTILRQSSIINADDDADLFVIIGSKDSSNTKRLAELAKKHHPNADVIQVLNLEELKELDLSKYKKAVLASGASSNRTTYIDIENYLNNLR